MKKGDKITLKTGEVVTVTNTGTPDFVGDPCPVYWQGVRDGAVITGFVMSDELKARQADE